jgi:hypothetical protein
MPEDSVSSIEQMRMLPDPGTYPSNCTDARPMRRR